MFRQEQLAKHIIELSAIARASWEAQLGLWRAAKVSPNIEAVETHLTLAVSLCAFNDPAAHAALQDIYPAWVKPTEVNDSPRLNAVIAESMFEIENRIARAFGITSDQASQRASFRRQATLIDLINDEERHIHALDSLMEGLLEAEIAPKPEEGGETWKAAAQAYVHLSDTPMEIELRSLPLTPRSEDLERASDFARALADAVDASPPAIWRFVSSDAPISVSYAAALRAPLMAAELLEQLQDWTGHAGFSKHAAERIGQGHSTLVRALEGWLKRSAPTASSPARSLERQFSDWQKHFMRARAVKAQTWWSDWFAVQRDRTITIGSEMLNVDGVRPSGIVRYANLCLYCHSAYDGSKERPTNWYINEAERAATLLRPEEAASIIGRVTARRTGDADASLATNIASWSKDDFPSTPIEREAVRRILEVKQSEFISPLGRWIIAKSTALLKRMRPPQPPVLNVELEERRLVDLVVEPGIRVEWLRQIQEDRINAGWDNFLNQLQQAIIEIFGRGDSAVDIAIARRLAISGQLDAARKQLITIQKLDKRARTQSICEMYLATNTLEQGPLDGRFWYNAYGHLLKSWQHTSDFGTKRPESIGALLLAAKLACRAGWSQMATFCTAQIRHARNGQIPVDRMPLVTNRFRLEAIARWAMTRPHSEKGLLLRKHFLKQAANELQNLQSTYAENVEDLVHGRRVVALLASCVPANSVIPDLISVTPHHRLHALAIGFQKNGRRAIDRVVLTAALSQLENTPETATFIGAWLVRSYFDDECFASQLTMVLNRMRRRTHFEASVVKLLEQIPKLMAEEAAARCAEAVRGSARPGHTERTIDQIKRLMRGNEIARRLQPSGYKSGGNLYVDSDVLRSLSDAQLNVDVPHGLWIEALFGARILDAFGRHLRSMNSMEQQTAALHGVTRLHRARLSLRVNDGFPCLAYEGMMVAKRGVPDAEWDAAASAWATSFRHSVFKLRSRRPHVPEPSFQFEIRTDRLEVITNVPLWHPDKTSAANIESQIQSLLDRSYGIHLARLAGRLPGDVTRAPISVLHTAIGALRKIDSPEFIEQPRERNLLLRAVVNAAAEEVAILVRSPAGRAETNVFEVLSAAAATYGVGDVPEELRNVMVAMPRAQLRLTLMTLFENATKAKAKHGGDVLVRASVGTESTTLVIDAPFLAPGEYPAGMRVGIESVTSYVEFYGGMLRQGKIPGQDIWRVEMLLPFVGAASDEDNKFEFVM